MKKFLVIIISIILLIALYFVYAKSTCARPYLVTFVLSQDSSGTISETKQCMYVGWRQYSSYKIIDHGGLFGPRGE
jgi:uncharacterized protein YxeA